MQKKSDFGHQAAPSIDPQKIAENECCHNFFIFGVRHMKLCIHFFTYQKIRLKKKILSKSKKLTHFCFKTAFLTPEN